MGKLKVIQKLTTALKKPGTKRILTISAIVLIAGTGLFFGIRYYLDLREKTRNPWDFVPENSLSIIQVNNVRDFVSASVGNSFFADFENLLHSYEVRNTFRFFDSLFMTKDLIEDAWLEGNLLISTNYVGSDKYETVFLKPLPHPNYESRVYQFFEKHATAQSESQLKSVGKKAKKFTFGNKEYYVFIKDGICIFSKSLGMIDSCLRASSSANQLLSDPSFKAVEATAGKNCIASVYINYRFVYRFLSSFLNNETLKILDAVNNFAGWSSYDIHPGENKIFLTGYTSALGVDKSWLNVFSTSKPQTTDIVDIMPFTTTSFCWLGFESYEFHREEYKKYLASVDEVSEFNNNLTNLKRRTGVQNINDLVFPHIDNQMALVTLPAKGGKGNSNYGIFKIKDMPSFRKNLIDISRSAAKTSGSSTDTSSYRNQIITTIHADYMLFDLFGKLFRNIEKTCYVTYDSYWIVGSSHEEMKEFLNQIMSGRTLPKNPMYEEFSTSISAEANVYIYSSPRKIKSDISTWFNENNTLSITENITEFDPFESIGIQFSSQNDMFLSAISLFRTTDPIEENLTGWEMNIDGQAASGPWFVDIADQNSKHCIVFDAFNNMYFISDKGELMWKIPLSERPISPVFSVDAFKNGKFQYLFSSENNIYLIDRNGKNVENFPMKMPVAASGPINVFDYDKSKEYRIVFVGIDNIIYNYTLKGEPTKGWEKPKLNTKAEAQMNHIRLVNSDALVIKDSENKLHFFNRRGLPLFEMDDITVSQYSKVYAASKLCRCYVTTSSDGQLVKIGTNGEIEYKTIHEAGSGHVFIYEDIDKDGDPDFIFIEKGKAYIFNKDGNVISSPEIGTDAGRTAGFIKESPFGPLLWVVSSDGSETFLLNKSGRILPEEHIASNGRIDFYTGPDSQVYIVSARNKSVYLTVID
jgi:hypothetical protein